MKLVIFFWLATALIVVGITTLTALSLQTLIDLGLGGIGWFKRRFQFDTVYRLAGLQTEFEILATEPGQRLLNLGLLLLSPYFWAIVSTLVALLVFDPMLSPILFVIVQIAGVLYRSQQRQQRLARLNRRTGDLILQFTSRYPLVRSVGQALQAAHQQLPEGEMRQATTAVIRRIQLNQPVGQAMEPFEQLPTPSLQQFAVILAHAQQTTPAIFQDTLEMLRADVEGRRELHNLSRQSLTLIRSTARVLQAVLAGALIFVSTATGWRMYFEASFSHLIIFWVAAGLGVLGSLYIESEIQLLEL
jgi:hypothetical protein